MCTAKVDGKGGGTGEPLGRHRTVVLASCALRCEGLGMDASRDAEFMDLALVESRAALERGEVPIACVLVDGSGSVAAIGSNRTNELRNATAHAEFVAFRALGERQIPPRSLTLYVTCEPCIMCAAAIVETDSVHTVVFGCSNPRFGGCGSVRDLDMYTEHGARTGIETQVPIVRKGVRSQEAVQLLNEFYMMTNPNAPESKRKKKRKKPEQAQDIVSVEIASQRRGSSRNGDATNGAATDVGVANEDLAARSASVSTSGAESSNPS